MKCMGGQGSVRYVRTMLGSIPGTPLSNKPTTTSVEAYRKCC